MIGDTAFYRNPNHHRPSDTWQTLDYERMVEAVRGLTAAVADLAGAGESRWQATLDADPNIMYTLM